MSIYQFENWIDKNIKESKEQFEKYKYIRIFIPQNQETYQTIWYKIESEYRIAGWKTKYVSGMFVNQHYIHFEKNDKPYGG